MNLSQAPIFEKCSYRYYIFDIYLTIFKIKFPLSLFDSYLTQAAEILNISGFQEQEPDLHRQPPTLPLTFL